MANFGSAFGAGFQGATHAQNTLSNLQNQQDQDKARAMLTQILQQYSQQQPAQGPTAPPNPTTPPNFQGPPMPQPSGVSPQGGASVPAAGAPGGAGPTSPMGGAPVPGGLDMQRLVQSIMAQKGSSGGAQGYALQDALKMLQPQANNALKLDLGQQRDSTQRYGIDTRAQTQEDIASKNINARKAIADANNLVRSKTNKPVNDPTFRALEDNVKALQSAYATSGDEATYGKLTEASAQLLQYAQKTTPATSAPAMTRAAPAQESQPIPDSNKSDPDGTSYPGPGGSVWVKQGGVVIKQ